MDKNTGSGRGFRLCNCRCCDRSLPTRPLRAYVVAAGVVFDAWGTPLVVVSSVVASLVAFLLSRHVLRPKTKASPRKSPAAARNRCGHWIPELASRHPAAAKRASAFQFPELLPRGNGHRACALCYNCPFRHYAFCDNVRLSRECRTDHCD